MRLFTSLSVLGFVALAAGCSSTGSTTPSAPGGGIGDGVIPGSGASGANAAVAVR